MTARPPESYVHGIDGPVAVVPGRVAAWLVRRLQLDRVRAEIRGTDPEVDAVLLALTVAGAAWRARSCVDATPLAQSAQPASSSELTTNEAARRAGVTPQAIRKAITANRLPARRVGPGWLVEPAELDLYRTRTAARRS